MLRKFSLVAVAAASLAAAALAPTSASAFGGHGGWHGGWHGGRGWGGPRFFVGGPAYGYNMATAAAMCGNWSRRRGGPAGAW